jgi:ATP-dependent DNA ligase
MENFKVMRLPIRKIEAENWVDKVDKIRGITHIRVREPDHADGRWMLQYAVCEDTG